MKRVSKTEHTDWLFISIPFLLQIGIKPLVGLEDSDDDYGATDLNFKPLEEDTSSDNEDISSHDELTNSEKIMDLKCSLAKPAVVEHPLDNEAAFNENNIGAVVCQQSEANKLNQQINGLEVSMSNSTSMQILPMRKAKVSSHFIFYYYTVCWKRNTNIHCKIYLNTTNKPNFNIKMQSLKILKIYYFYCIN